MNTNLGFKGTNKNLFCRDKEYKLNIEYDYNKEIGENIEICKRGYHFCKKLEDVFGYYDLYNNNRYFLVKYNENNYIEENDKCVTDKITFLKEISDPESLKYLLECSIYKDFLKENIDSILKIYVYKRDLEVVNYLVEKGADVTADNNLNVRLASYHGHLETVKYLVEKGADVTAENNYAVRWASYREHLETVKYLVEKGADVTVDNNYISVIWGSENRYPKIIKYS